VRRAAASIGSRTSRRPGKGLVFQQPWSHATASSLDGLGPPAAARLLWAVASQSLTRDIAPDFRSRVAFAIPDAGSRAARLDAWFQHADPVARAGIYLFVTRLPPYDRRRPGAQRADAVRGFKAHSPITILTRANLPGTGGR